MTKKCKLVLFSILALLLCVSLALGTYSLTNAFAEEATPEETESARTPAFTYIVGDADVTDEAGFTFDEATKTYNYRNHLAGLNAAISKSAGLHDTENADANLVEVKLASTWNATAATNVAAAIIISNTECNILLDLNGYDIDRGLTAGVTGGRAINVTGGTLEITDTSAEGTGKITGGYLPSGHNGAGIFVQGNTSKVILSGGSIEGNVGSRGGAISMTGGTFIMNGGIIKANRALSQGHGVHVGGGSFIMNGGSVCDHNETAVPGGAFVVTGGSLTVNGGTIKNNLGSNGGAINIQGGRVYINGGEISHNTAKGNNADNSNGGAIYVSTNCYLYVNGGEISHNFSGGAGGAIWGYNIEVSGGNICENYASGNGGAMHVRGNVLSLKNCEISGNNGNGGNGAYYCYSGDIVVTLGGAVILKDNTKGATLNDDGTFSGGTVSNTAVRQNQKFAIADKLCDDEGNKAEFHFECALNNPITEGYEQNNLNEYGVPVAPSEYFKSDNAAQHVIMNADGEVCMSKSVLAWDVTCKEAADAAVNHKSAYGVNVTYSVNEVNAVTLTQDGTDVADLTYTNAKGEAVAAPLVNAGTYYVVAEVNGYGNNKVNAKYVVVIAPYDISNGQGEAIDGVTYTIDVSSDWTKEGDTTKYNATYNGSAKAMPAATVTVNSTTLIADADFEVVGVIDGVVVAALNNVGEYAVELRGVGNYTGAIALGYSLSINPDTTKDYTTSWQYFDGETWVDLADVSLIYSTTNYSANVRVKLVQEDTGEIRYVYAHGTENCNLVEDEDEADVTRAITVGIAKGDETVLLNAGSYTLSIAGVTNYNVAEADATRTLDIAPYSLEGKGEEIINSFALSPTSTVYNGEKKEITNFVASIVLDSTVTFGEDGAEYVLIVKYVGKDGEAVVDQIILGGEYRLYIEATGNNFTGTSDAIATITIAQATNGMGWRKIGNWVYGSFDVRVNNSVAYATYLHDGTIAPAQYVMYTILDSEGNAVNATLTKFTDYNAVAEALNALAVGSYTVYAEVAETESYLGRNTSFSFDIAQARNGWTESLDIIGWAYGSYSKDANIILGSVINGEISYTLKGNDGKAVAGLESFTKVTDEVAALLAKLAAGDYTLTATVNSNSNYYEVNAANTTLKIAKAENDWKEALDVISWSYGSYNKDTNRIMGSVLYGTVTYSVTKGGTEVAGLESFTEVNDTIASKLAALAAGGYTVTATVAVDGNHEALAKQTVIFNVAKGANDWKVPFDVINWAYGGFDKDTNRIMGAVQHGTVTYSVTKDGTTVAGLEGFTEVTDAIANVLAGLAAGSYTVTATVTEESNYMPIKAGTATLNVAKAVNSWSVTPSISSWVKGEYNSEENVAVAADAFNSTINYVIYESANPENIIYKIENGNVVIDELANAEIGSYTLVAIVNDTVNYSGLEKTFTFQIFAPEGLPWWGTTLVAVGAIGLIAAVILILWKLKVFEILTDKISLAITTRATVDATIAAIRATKQAEEAEAHKRKVEARERLEAAREAHRNKTPEQRAQDLNAKAEVTATQADKLHARAAKMRERANKLTGSTETVEEAVEQPEQTDDTSTEE